MPAWNELLDEYDKFRQSEQGQDPKIAGWWLLAQQQHWLHELSQKREGRNIIFYGSGFLSKPRAVPFSLQITNEDINGFMTVLSGMDCNKGLTLILHTPGGVTNATETIVEYLHNKFGDIEVIIPTFAMSAGTMISLAADRIIMGRQSQLGPIDPQIPFGGRTVSARAIVNQFKTAKNEILEDPKMAAVYAPMLHQLGPDLLQAATDALDYGETMVSRWLLKRRFKSDDDGENKARQTATHFNRSEIQKSHGRRIDREEAREHNLLVMDLEDDQELQDIALTNYHIATMIFEHSPCTKFIVGDHGKSWIKNMPTGSTS